MIDRRSFLKLLGVAGAAVVVPELIVEPRRRIWQVSRAAPVDVGAAMRAYATLDSIPVQYFEDRDILVAELIKPNPFMFKQSIELDLDALDGDPHFRMTIDKFREVMASAIDDALIEQLVNYPAPRG